MYLEHTTVTTPDGKFQPVIRQDGVHGTKFLHPDTFVDEDEAEAVAKKALEQIQLDVATGLAKQGFLRK